MSDMVRKALSQFLEIESLLSSTSVRDQNYFMVLNESANQAYLTMNNEMCANATVCQHCAEHRDYLFSILSTLDDLSSGTEFSQVYQDELAQFSKKINDILLKISNTLASL